MYKCDHCGCEFKATYNKICPTCGGNELTPIKYCKICGTETIDNICESCFNKKATPEKIIQYGEETREEIKLNPIFTLEMGVNEIETVLAEYLKRTGRFNNAIEELKANDHLELTEWLAQ